MTGLEWVSILIRVVGALVLLLLATILNVWIERKVVADMQNRLGPMRAGPHGVLQTLADALKLLFKESIVPNRAEVAMFVLAPFLATVPAFLIFMNVPWGGSFHIGDTEVTLLGADLNIGLLFILAMSSMAVYSTVLAGWSSGSKYPLLGGVRATAQAISYEAAIGLSLVAVVLFSATQGDGGTLSLQEIVLRQQGNWGDIHPLLSWVPRWNIIPQIAAFVIFLIAAVAETNRPPFDLVEAEQELVGGYHTEYSGMRFAMFFLAEYINVFSMSAITATLFLGGWLGPTWEGTLPAFVSGALPTVWFLLKTYAIFFVFIWIRATLPRLRYDQLMTLGWKRLIPAALGWVVLSGVVLAWRQFGLPWG
ncbi:MAG: NADH-quinone oxidoreductase subunit NuoH [Actinomycetes bacterium]|jgi:NADH-quinone oxidoreductase subunit H